MIRLNKIKKNNTGIIKQIGGNETFKVRLYDMGLNKGEKITCILVSPGKHMKAYLIKNTLISLRDSDAKSIMVEVI